MNKFIVYKITHKKSLKSYIGITTDYQKRMREHKQAKGGCRYLYNAVRRYGFDAFEHKIIAKAHSWEELCLKEQAFIKFFGTKAPDGYNLTDGGEGSLGLKPSAETRQKMSEAQKGNKGNTNMLGKKLSDETRQKIGEASKGNKYALGNTNMLGKKHSNETKRKMSEAKRGRKFSDETKRKMSEAAKGRKTSDETRKKLSEAKRGRKLSDETRQKMSEAQKGNTKMLGKKHSNEAKRKMSEASKGNTNMLGKKFSDELKKKMSEAQRKFSRFQVLEIKKLLSEGVAQRTIAKQFGVTHSTIGNIKTGKRYADIV